VLGKKAESDKCGAIYMDSLVAERPGGYGAAGQRHHGTMSGILCSSVQPFMARDGTSHSWPKRAARDADDLPKMHGDRIAARFVDYQSARSGR
jgi:hypothetical protein